MGEPKRTGSESLKDTRELSALGEVCTGRMRTGGRWGWTCGGGEGAYVKDLSALCYLKEVRGYFKGKGEY